MSIRLFILGTLAKENNHPYMIKKKLTSLLPMNSISEGKFYYNFEALQKKGHIQQVEVIQEGNRPDKTLYSITSEGRKALEQDIYNSFKKISTLQELYISIYLLEFVDPSKAAQILEETIDREKKRWQEYEELEKSEALQAYLEKMNHHTRESIEFIGSHAFSNAAFNIEWLEKLLTFIKKYEV